MIAGLIRWSIANRFMVLLATLMITSWGIWSLSRTPLDAIPDLSDVQVIIRTMLPGQAPQIVENQVTYPLATTMLSVPGAKTVRGYSMFGDSFVYILFDDGTDPYWARSRVLEYLNQVQSRLPPQAKTSLGPDATGVGWVYEYALIDRSGKMDLSQLRALQDWFLKYELKTVPNVSEVASVGGMVRQYQIVLDPDKLRAYNITHGKVIDAVRRANQEAGGAVLELGDYLYGHSDSKGWICQEFKSGDIKWSEKGVGKGAIGYADGHFYCRSEGNKGTVALIEATPEGYKEKGRFEQPERSAKNSWPHPVIANGRLYLRDQDVLLSYDVRKK